MTREEATRIVANVYSKFGPPFTDRTLAEAEIDVLTALGLFKVEEPPDVDHWLKPGACVPITPDTVVALIKEIQRLRSMPSPNGIKP